MPRRTKRLKHKTRKGGFYGFQGGIPGSSGGAPDWRAGSEMGGFSLTNRGGNGMIGRGRKKRSPRKTKRGGSAFGSTYAGFVGTGSRGMIDVVAGTHKPGVAQYGQFNVSGGSKKKSRKVKRRKGGVGELENAEGEIDMTHPVRYSAPGFFWGMVAERRTLTPEEESYRTGATREQRPAGSPPGGEPK